MKAKLAKLLASLERLVNYFIPDEFAGTEAFITGGGTGIDSRRRR